MKQISFLLVILFLISCKDASKNVRAFTEPVIGFVDLCSDEEFRGSCNYEIEENQNRTYYNKQVVSINNEHLVTFDFIDLCCLTFDGSSKIENEILTLYFFKSDPDLKGCECRCNYQMSYRFKKRDYKWKRIVVKKMTIKK